MRTEHNRFACENRFDGILSSVRGETFPYEHHSGDCLPALKFSSRLEKHAIRIVCAAVSASLASVTHTAKRPSARGFLAAVRRAEAQ